MIRYGHLYTKISDFQNVYFAYLKARKNKRYKPGVLEYTENLEHNLIEVWHELQNKSYKIGPYKSFTVYEPKKREIFALAFRDRVVQHALIAVIEPILSKSFIVDTYACQAGKGTHAGLRCLHRFVDGEDPECYFLKADITKFFPSVDKEVLKRQIRKRIKCKDTLWLIDLAIDSSPAGLPIGNLTSQLFANYYLSDLDHIIKEQLHERRYVRYMDDFIIVNPSLEKLKADRAEIVVQLDRIGLRLNSKTSIAKLKQGVDFLGYRTWPHVTKLRKRNIRKNRRKFRKMGRRLDLGKTNIQIISRSLASLHGYTKYAACAKTKEGILKGVCNAITCEV